MAVVQKLICTVEKIVNHGEQVYTLELEPERALPRFQPGQFLHLALDDYDPSGFWPESRVFSIASSPLQRWNLRISYSVRGRFTDRMEKDLREGMRIWVKLPYGDFIIDGHSNIVLIAGGTGITAFTAFLDGLKAEHKHAVYLVYGARRRDLLIYRRLLEQRAKEIPQLRIFYFIEKDMDNTLTIEENNFLGRLSVSTLLPMIKNPLESIFYLSGPPQMLKVLSHDLIRAAIQKESIRIDAWG
ncbi:MAG: FAD-dependent oxidoreductase [Syntrophaceae bacterium]